MGNLTLNRPQAIKLLARMKRAPNPDQLDILTWIIQKFPAQIIGILKSIEKNIFLKSKVLQFLRIGKHFNSTIIMVAEILRKIDK